MNPPLFHSDLPSLQLLGRGKVRDIYAIDSERLLIVTTDRLSAFDVVLPTPIPGKGEVLTRMSAFWFNKLSDILPSQLTGIDPATVVATDAERAQVAGRALVVKRLKPLPIEAIVRGYLAGSGWKDYQAAGTVCGIALPAGLKQAERLPAPIFTPSTKPSDGTHDENISFDQAAALVGEPLAREVRDKAIAIYRRAAAWAAAQGILVCDTKFEFGVDAEGRLHWIDEALTPDSSRFWPADQYAVGSNPPSFDKQFVRDWLESLHWNKRPPAPEVPPEIVEKTAAKYQEALYRLTGERLAG